MEDPSTNAPSSCVEKNLDETASNKTAQCTVIAVYRTMIAGVARRVTVMWNKNLINHSFSVSVENSDADGPLTCKVELKPWPFWSKKGSKPLEIDGSRLDVFWDLRSAKFSGSPEPSGNYYVALVCNEEVILLLGDCKKDAYKKTKSRPSLEDATLLCKRENVFGKKSFCTRTRFDDRKKEHDIVVENSISGPKDPEMWISIDGVVLIHVDNLRWKFRGNETVIVERTPVQVFWDVHDWLFGGPGSHALFIFKPGPALERQPVDDDHQNGISQSDNEQHPLVRTCRGAPEFCFFLYAWKLE
ncbi:uncharacterized protein [Typha angustifolia]|uniref:uncharacterized protein n=1 Tax=Typha angustifolia TaxID=59011 RepID=UPI003C2B0527